VCRRFDSGPGHERKYGRDKELENGGHHGMVAVCFSSPELLMDGGFRLLALCEADAARTLLGSGTRARNACVRDCTSCQ
jgi:hypothetical protein